MKTRILRLGQGNFTSFNKQMSTDIFDFIDKKVQQNVDKAVNVQFLRKNLTVAVNRIYNGAIRVATELMIGKLQSPGAIEALNTESGLQRSRRSKAKTKRLLAAKGKPLRVSIGAMARREASSQSGYQTPSEKLGIKVVGNSRIPFGDVTTTWAPLSPSWMMRKKSRTAALYFLHTRNLKSELKKLETGALKQFDLKTARSKKSLTPDKVKTVKLAEVRIKLLTGLPNVNLNNTTRFDDSMALERFWFQGETYHKLAGRQSHRRHLLQPVLTYYTLFRAPKMIADALNRSFS